MEALDFNEICFFATAENQKNGKNWDEVAKARGPLCANPCDEGIYIGMEIYLFFSLVIPLVICCCMCCCLGFIASRESAK